MVGHETTAGVINMTLYQLARHPSIQSRLRNEIRANGRDLTYEDVNRLEYLDAVVKEGLRLHPASPQTERVALKDDFIPLANGQTVHVKKGQVFVISFQLMNTDESVWGVDAAVFNPDRWLSDPKGKGGAKLPNTWTGWNGLATFCDGPRNCIGYRLGTYFFPFLGSIISLIHFPLSLRQPCSNSRSSSQPSSGA
jgi:cytochrome P450